MYIGNIYTGYSEFIDMNEINNLLDELQNIN